MDMRPVDTFDLHNNASLMYTLLNKVKIIYKITSATQVFRALLGIFYTRIYFETKNSLIFPYVYPVILTGLKEMRML